MNLKRAQGATAWNVRAGASEFPHANPALDWGAAWLGSALCDLPTQAEPHATADVTTSTTEPHPTSDVTTSTTAPLTETMVVTETMVEMHPIAPAPPPPPTFDPTPDMQPPPDPTPTQLVVTLGADTPTVAQAADSVAEAPAPPLPEALTQAPAQTPSAAVATTAEVEDGWLFFVGAVETVLEGLGSGDIARRARSLLEGDDTGPTDGATALLTTAAAWRSVLIGERQDFDGCGDTTLDEWAARLLAELVPPGTPTSNLRRELRRQGVAAFGIVPTAAARARSAPVRAKESSAATPATQDDTVAA